MQSLRDRVSQVYYTHGLLCASHPISILVGVCVVIIMLCYPLVYVPLPGNIPVEYVTPSRNYKVPPEVQEKSFDVTDITSIPRWYKGTAVGYIQQLVVKATVSPWVATEHDPLDSLYAPLSKVFEILEHVEKIRHLHGNEEKSLVNCCLRVSEPLQSKHSEGLLPQYSCLILSPANMWQKSLARFLEDKEVLSTIYKRYNPTLDARPGIRDVLFGLPWQQTGISRYFIRNRQRTISFAITIVLKEYDESFVKSLRSYLENVYPDTASNVNNSEIDHVVHLHYKDVNIYFEYTHLIVLYLVLLLYIYFSVKKIEMVKSKWGLALSAVVTVVSSLLISVSVCSICGLNTRLNGGEIFPYLVVLIGMENVLVMTKSVVSTSIELDVKYRVATGLSKEGWSITKNLLIELAIVLIGFFTCVPAIQEFCLFALVGLLTDFFLQMIFFVTVLSVDIRRMELTDLHKHKQGSTTPATLPGNLEPLFKCPFKSEPVDKIKTQPKVNFSSGIDMLSVRGQLFSPKVQHEACFFQQQTFLGLPRRLRLIYFWASTRVVQRFIMVCTVIWIILIVYKTGLVHHLTGSQLTVNGTEMPPTVDDLEQIIQLQEQTSSSDTGKIAAISSLAFFWRHDVDDMGSVQHNDLETWRKLSHAHWTRLFGYYNISIVGKYIGILPSIHISIIIPPEEAIQLRVPDYRTYQPKNKPKYSETMPKTPEIYQMDNNNSDSDDVMKDLAQAESSVPHQHSQPHVNEPQFLSEEYLRKYYPYVDPQQLQQFYPKSRKEFLITLSLALLSVICVTYFMMALYRCMCSRKYSKWRASWSKVPRSVRANSYFRQIKESVPIVLRGHAQEIECLVTAGTVIVSSCLGGQLRVWDSITGECLHVMQRKSAIVPMKRKPCEGRNIEDSDADLYAEYHGNHGDNTISDIEIGQGNCIEYGQGEVDKLVPRHRGVSERKENQAQYTGGISERFENFPDLKHTIDVNFVNLYADSKFIEKNSLNTDINEICKDVTSPTVYGVGRTAGYNFEEKISVLYSEHNKFVAEKKVYNEHRLNIETREIRSKSWSEGDLALNGSMNLELPPSPIWCLACRGNLVIAGCGCGKIEFWDSVTGTLKCVYGESTVGVTDINLINKRVIAGRLDGSIDFLELETFQNPRLNTPLSPGSLNMKIKGHSRHLSHSRNGSDDMRIWDDVIHCIQIQHTQAHQRPITVLQTEGGRVVSGSQDFRLKVFRLEDYKCLYTLHGHTGSITCLYLDKCAPYAAVSGSADGTIRLWDLLSGTCVHKVIGHDGTVVGLTCTDSHIISSGLDDRMCVWQRKRGYLLYTVEMETSCGSSMSLLNSHFLVTGGQGSLYLWDIQKGELVRVINLQEQSNAAFIHHVQSMENTTIVCDYGKDIKVIHFPVVLEKRE